MHSHYCIEECHAIGGTWNTTQGVCYVPFYLQSICYRLSHGPTWQADREDLLALRNNPSHDIGCEYSNKWSPYVYSPKKVNSVRISLRSYLDSYIAASSATRGCSDTSVENNHCFGKAAYEQHRPAIILLIISLISMLIEVMVCTEWRKEWTYM